MNVYERLASFLSVFFRRVSCNLMKRMEVYFTCLFYGAKNGKVTVRSFQLVQSPHIQNKLCLVIYPHPLLPSFARTCTTSFFEQTWSRA